MSSLTRLSERRERWTLPSRLRMLLPRQSAEPSARMFAGIRHRLTLWYTGVLAVILLLSGLLLYVGMRTVLLNPIDDLLKNQTQGVAQGWQEHSLPPIACSSAPFSRESSPFFVACYDANGNEIGNNRLADLAPGFISPSLVQAALAAPSASALDTVDGGNGFGAIRRYALVIRDPTGQQTLGVLLIGASIEGEMRALGTLLELLLLVGVLTLLGSALGGVLLAHRAMAPARLAFARQQAFIADASHELRTPLTLLRADAEVMLSERERFTPDDAALLDDIVTEAEHLGSLAENLLILARLDSGAYHIEQDVVDLSEIASSTAHRVHALAEQHGIAVTVQSAGEALVIGDRTWLGQAVLILVDNAIKYNQAGGTVTLRSYLDGHHVVLDVRDTGVGISAEHLPHLGERFYRVDKARSRDMGGSGLGISIARGIATAHGGSLALISVPGEGTTATLRFPAATASAAPR